MEQFCKARTSAYFTSDLACIAPMPFALPAYINNMIYLQGFKMKRMAQAAAGQKMSIDLVRIISSKDKPVTSETTWMFLRAFQNDDCGKDLIVSY